MRTIPVLILALTAGLYGGTALSAETIGVRKISVVTQEYSRPLAVTVWYPSKGDGEKPDTDADRIFEGTAAASDATIRDGRFPLVLLSHGSGSRADGMGWIAARLAEEGYIVAGPNHPGTTSGDSTPAATPKIWERAQDISVLITALAADPHWQASIDPKRIGVLGFSLGGATAMELAGARPSLDAFVKYCDDERRGKLDCSWFHGGRGFAAGAFVKVEPFDLRSINRKLFEQSNRDARIASIVAIDPALGTVMKADSVKAIDVPVTLVNLGSEGEVPRAVMADELAKDIAGSTYVRVSNADHYSFLPICKPGAAEFLKSIGESDPICGDTSRSRADIHAELSQVIVAAFKRTLQTGN